jgi:MFS family permease
MTTPLKLPAFRNLVIGRIVSMFGNGVAPIALAFAVLDLTGSVSDLGLVVGVRSLFNVLFLLLGGVLADRLPRQFVMVGASSVAALSQASVAALLFSHHATVPLLMIIGAINGTTAAMSQPATAAVIAQTIPDELRKQGNAINRIGLNLAQILGVASGGLLVAAFGSAWGVAIDAATFAVSAFCFSLVRVPAYRDERAERTKLLHDLREGWSEFIARTWVWVVVLGFTFFNMAAVAALSVLGPALADVSFGRRAWGLILAADVAGNVIGALIAMRLRTRRLLYVGVVGCFGGAVEILALAGAAHVLILVVLFFVGGAAIELFGVAWEVSVQEHVPPDKLARVYSYDMLGSFIAIPIGQVLAGPLALALGVRGALVIGGAVSLVAVAAMIAVRPVRQLQHRSVVPVATDPEPAHAA